MALQSTSELLALQAPWALMPHEPTDHQWAAMCFEDSREMLYGGAAGGGKSDWLLMEALRYVDIPGYSALILRRTYPQLSQSDGLIPRAKDWLAARPEVDWSESKSRFLFPGGGTLTFGHLQTENDKYNYQGGAWQCICFDELTQFTEPQYLYLFSRLRKPEETQLGDVPLRMRSASNPGGVGHDWVRQRFVIESHPERVFLPAALQDNPYLDRDEYTASLEHLHPYERAQLLRGDWDARRPGSRFKREWFKILEDEPPGPQVRFWDLAATEPKPGADPDWTVGVRLVRGGPGYVVSDVQRFRGDPGTVDRRILAQAELDGPAVAIRIEQEGGSSGKIAMSHFSQLLGGYDFRGVPATGDKVVRSNPLASDAFKGEVGIVRAPWTEEYLRELEGFPGGSHDDQVDASSGAHSYFHFGRGVTPTDLYGDDTEEELDAVTA